MSNIQPKDENIIRCLQRQDSHWTIVRLKGDIEYRVFNIAWGYDIGEAYAHVTTNISPEQLDTPIDFFCTSDVVEIVNELDERILYLKEEQ